jgi:hypothetical protein
LQMSQRHTARGGGVRSSGNDPGTPRSRGERTLPLPDLEERRRLIAENIRIARADEAEQERINRYELSAEKLRDDPAAKANLDERISLGARGRRVELRCECGRPGCDELVKLEPFAYLVTKEEPASLVMVRGHEVTPLEHRMPLDKPFGGGDYVKIEAPRPSSWNSLDVKTLRGEVESLRAVAAERRADLKEKLAELGRGAATAALILTVFAAFRPEKGSLVASLLFAGAAVPFIAIVRLSLAGAAPVEEELQARNEPSLDALGVLGRIHREWQASAWVERRERPLSLASYDQRARFEAARERVRQDEPARILLPEPDWLVNEIDRLRRAHVNYGIATKAARAKVGSLTIWLFVLVLYLLVTTVVTVAVV